MTDPYTNQQIRFYRTDPTGRINRLQDDVPSASWAMPAPIMLVVTCILIASAILRMGGEYGRAN